MRRTLWALCVLVPAVIVIAASPCSAESRTLNKAQVLAAPKDNPGVKTVGGYLEVIVLKDDNGKPITGAKKREMVKLFAAQGIEESTVWLDEKGRASWEARAAINSDGTFSQDTLIRGRNGNEGRTELRKKGPLPGAAQQPGRAATAPKRPPKAASLPRP